MDPITAMFLGSLILTGFGWVGIRVTTDAYATVKAAKEGQWDWLTKDRERRAASRQAWARAWGDRRRARHEAAGGDGNFRPGAREYLADLYHGFWEDQLERRAAKRAARGPYVYDPNRLTLGQRFDARVMRKVNDLRERWGQRVPEPVEDTPLDELLDGDEPAPVPVEPVVYEPGTWTYDDRGERVDLSPTDEHPRDNTAANDSTDEQDTESTDQGGTTMTTTTAAAVATEVQDNEAARRNFKAQQEAAGEGLEALAMYEAAIARLAGAANASADGMAATRFDSGATGAQANITDLIPASSIAAAAGALEEMKVHAEAGLRHLDKYRDAEELVASENVDAKTLEPTSA